MMQYFNSTVNFDVKYETSGRVIIAIKSFKLHYICIGVISVYIIYFSTRNINIIPISEAPFILGAH